jgi:quercetin dioxygenase-like cupin family protein
MIMSSDPGDTSAHTGFVLTEDEGDAFWFLNTVTINKVGGDDTQGNVTIVDHRVPAGFAPPPHIHQGADEAFYILDGEFEGFCGDQQWRAGPGSLVFLPRDVPHGFTVSDAGPGRALLVLAPAGFERFVAALGEATTDLTLPQPTAPDVARVVELAAAHGIQILPPPAD